MRLKLHVPVLFAAGFAVSYAIASPAAVTALMKTGTTKNEKVTLCHKTHSKSHPSVTIKVSGKAVKAHMRHGDTRGACPARTSSTSSSTSTSTVERKVTICHKAGSATNSYVRITVSESAIVAHRRHGDIVPAPAGGCPTGASGTSTGATTSGKGKGKDR